MKNTPTLASLANDLEDGRTTARQLVDECLARIAEPSGEGARVFITRKAYKRLQTMPPA